jgi:colicin import membrane protein
MTTRAKAKAKPAETKSPVQPALIPTNIVDPKNPVDVAPLVLNAAAFDEFYMRLEIELAESTPDVTTEKGRKSISSLAYKVSRCKTIIDDAGKSLNEDARAKIAVVDEARRGIRSRLEDLQTRIKAPLDAWTVAEEKRVNAASEIKSVLAAAGSNPAPIGCSAVSVRNRIADIGALDIDPDVFGTEFDAVVAERARVVELLGVTAAKLDQDEKDRIELGRLRAANLEREEKEREAEAERQRAADALEAEKRALAAEQERVAALAKQNAEAEDRRVAHEAQLAKDREDARAAAEYDRKVQAEAEAKRLADAEIELAAAVQRARQDELDRLAVAEKVRQLAEDARVADATHRAAIVDQATISLAVAASLSKEAARTIIETIMVGQVRHVSIKF